jgi:hypothetical protein
MPDSKLMSYIISDFQSQSDLNVGQLEWEKIMEEKFQKFKNAGALRQTASQIWNKEGALRLGHLWKYKDEKSFVQCQKFLEKLKLNLKQKLVLNGKFFQIEVL